jgi:hypothetical protein
MGLIPDEVGWFVYLFVCFCFDAAAVRGIPRISILYSCKLKNRFVSEAARWRSTKRKLMHIGTLLKK